MMGILSDYMYVSPKNESSSKEVNQHLLFWAVIFPNAPGTPDRDHHTDGKQNLDMKRSFEPWFSKFTLCKSNATKTGQWGLPQYIYLYKYIYIQYIYIYTYVNIIYVYDTYKYIIYMLHATPTQ